MVRPPLPIPRILRRRGGCGGGGGGVKGGVHIVQIGATVVKRGGGDASPLLAPQRILQQLAQGTRANKALRRHRGHCTAAAKAAVVVLFLADDVVVAVDRPLPVGGDTTRRAQQKQQPTHRNEPGASTSRLRWRLLLLLLLLKTAARHVRCARRCTIDSARRNRRRRPRRRRGRRRVPAPARRGRAAFSFLGRLFHIVRPHSEITDAVAQSDSIEERRAVEGDYPPRHAVQLIPVLQTRQLHLMFGASDKRWMGCRLRKRI